MPINGIARKRRRADSRRSSSRFRAQCGVLVVVTGAPRAQWLKELDRDDGNGARAARTLPDGTSLERKLHRATWKVIRIPRPRRSLHSGNRTRWRSRSVTRTRDGGGSISRDGFNLQQPRCVVDAGDDDRQCGRSIAEDLGAQPGTLRDKFSIGEKEGDLEQVIE